MRPSTWLRSAFVGLGLEDAVPDAKTLWLYREALAKAGAGLSPGEPIRARELTNLVRGEFGLDVQVKNTKRLHPWNSISLIEWPD